MAIVSKPTAKSYFETGDKPTQGQFSDFIDSAVFTPSSGLPGVIEVESETSATVRAVGTVGATILSAETQASAQAALGSSGVGLGLVLALGG